MGIAYSIKEYKSKSAQSGNYSKINEMGLLQDLEGQVDFNELISGQTNVH
jgi:hypothetical protein